MKLYKKAQTWKYIVGAIIVLITFGVLLWIIFRQRESMQNIIESIKNIIS